METIYRYFRAGLMIVTIIPLLLFIAYNNTWDGLLDDLLG